MATADLNYNFGLRDETVSDVGDKLVVSGLASNFDLDRENERMSRTAFDRGLRRYLASNPILLYNHQYSRPVGKVTSAKIDARGLWITAELPKPAAGTADYNLWQLVKRG